MEHLLGQTLGDFVLELPAVGEKGGEPLVTRECQEPPLAEQQSERRADRTPGRLHHVGDLKVEPARTLPARRGNKPERPAVHQKARRHAGLTQHALHARVGRDIEPPAVTLRAVEVCLRLEDTDEELPGPRTVLRFKLAHRVVGTKRHPRVGERHFQLGRHGTLVRPRVALRGEAPAKDALGEVAEVGDAGGGDHAGGVVAAGRPLTHTARHFRAVQAFPEQPLSLGIAPVEDRPRANEGGRGNDEARRPDEAQPLEVRLDVRIPFRHDVQFVSGQR